MIVFVGWGGGERDSTLHLILMGEGSSIELEFVVTTKIYLHSFSCIRGGSPNIDMPSLPYEKCLLGGEGNYSDAMADCTDRVPNWDVLCYGGNSKDGYISLVDEMNEYKRKCQTVSESLKILVDFCKYHLKALRTWP